ncbi:MAG: hypothetical protein M1829_005253 [Trizodia sp. TS-e1964]|nr:MAG: hypothetical protein M1829_005253 [Trizodia sp. TS-e1964]
MLLFDLLFDIGCSRIQDLVGRFINAEFHMPREFQDAKRGFWEAMMVRFLANIRSVPDENPDAMKMSVRVGTLFGDAAHIDGEVSTCCRQISHQKPNTTSKTRAVATFFANKKYCRHVLSGLRTHQPDNLALVKTKRLIFALGGERFEAR